jgi:hypothetical protein
MAVSTTIASLPAPVPVPIEIGSTPLDDYAALLVRLREAERLAEGLRQERDQAEDHLWARFASALAPSPSSNWLESLPQPLRQMLADEAIEVVLPGGRLDEQTAVSLEVLCTRPTDDPLANGVIAETWRPLVRRRGRTIQTAQVVVLKYSASPAGA